MLVYLTLVCLDYTLYKHNIVCIYDTFEKKNFGNKFR